MFGAVIAISRLHTAACVKCENLIFSKTIQQCYYQKLSHVKFYQYTPGVRNFGNSKTALNNTLRKNIPGISNAFRQTFSLRPKVLQIIKRKYANPLTANTNVLNNVMLYRNERPYMFKVANIFGAVACIGLLTMANNVYLVLCQNLFNPHIPLLTRLLDHVFPIAAIIIGVLGGPAFMMVMMWITKRNIKYAILRSGGKEVTFATYHPFKHESVFTVPVRNISCDALRSDSKSYVPIRIKHMKRRLIFDKIGFFVNPELFDATVGIKRF